MHGPINVQLHGYILKYAWFMHGPINVQLHGYILKYAWLMHGPINVQLHCYVLKYAWFMHGPINVQYHDYILKYAWLMHGPINVQLHDYILKYAWFMQGPINVQLHGYILKYAWFMHGPINVQLHGYILKYTWFMHNSMFSFFDRNSYTKDLNATSIESEFTLYIRNKYRNKLDIRHYILAAIKTTSLCKIRKHSITLLQSLVNRDTAQCLLETSTKKVWCTILANPTALTGKVRNVTRISK
jgi:hypothetical protein